MGKVAEKGALLATVLERMLVPDAWTMATNAYPPAPDRYVPVRYGWCSCCQCRTSATGQVPRPYLPKGFR